MFPPIPGSLKKSAGNAYSTHGVLPCISTKIAGRTGLAAPLQQSRLIGDPGHFNNIKLYQKQHQDENINTVYELPKFSNFFIILIQSWIIQINKAAVFSSQRK